MIYARAYDQLKDITSDMSTKMSRVFAESLANGLSAEATARKLHNTVDGIDRKRARTFARTEIIHAHAEGQLDSFDKLGIEELGVVAEWNTAGDDYVCSQCAALEGKTFTIQEARGMIPLHPNCRCCWVPKNAEATTTTKRAPAVSKPVKDEGTMSSKSAALPKNVQDKIATIKTKIQYQYKDYDSAVSGMYERANVASVYSEMTKDRALKSLNAIHNALSDVETRAPGALKIVRGSQRIVKINLHPGKSIPGKPGVMGTFTRGANKIDIAGERVLKTRALPKNRGYSAGNDLGSVFRHEFSHSVYAGTEKIDGRFISQHWFHIHKDLGKNYFKRNVSGYAETSIEEAFAEAFTLYTNPSYTKGMLDKSIEDFFEKAFGV